MALWSKKKIQFGTRVRKSGKRSFTLVIKFSTNFCLSGSPAPILMIIINPRRACAARVTVVGWSACLPVCLSACLPVCLSACLPVCLSACLPVCLSVCLSVCLCVCVCVCVCRLALQATRWPISDTSGFQNYASLTEKRAILLKRLRSRDMP